MFYYSHKSHLCLLQFASSTSMFLIHLLILHFVLSPFPIFHRHSLCPLSSVRSCIVGGDLTPCATELKLLFRDPSLPVSLSFLVNYFCPTSIYSSLTNIYLNCPYIFGYFSLQVLLPNHDIICRFLCCPMTLHFCEDFIHVKQQR